MWTVYYNTGAMNDERSTPILGNSPSSESGLGAAGLIFGTPVVPFSIALAQTHTCRENRWAGQDEIKWPPGCIQFRLIISVNLEPCLP
jgi:hypothetical protein